MDYAIYINGVELPTPAFSGVTISKNKVWSSNTGRDTTGTMVGTLLSVKSKLEINWKMLTQAQAAVINGVISDVGNAFTTVSYVDYNGVRVSKTMYFGDISFGQYSYADGLRYLSSVSVSCIEA